MAKAELTILHLFPELLNLYGDTGNMLVLEKRLAWRGMQAHIIPVSLGQSIDLSSADIVFVGGGSDREQGIVGEELVKHTADFKAYAKDGGVLLAVCGGYQLLGHEYSLGENKLSGLGLLDIYTVRKTPRLIGNIACTTELFSQDVVGYENHGGRTYLGSDVTPFARVLHGFGNDGASGFEGARANRVIGTYIHGPLLPKNPELADWLLSQALERKGLDPVLSPLDDTAEKRANEYAAKLS